MKNLTFFRMVSSILEVLDGCYTVGASSDVVLKSTAVQLATQLLTIPTASCIQLQAKSLLAALHSTLQAYHSYKVLFKLFDQFLNYNITNCASVIYVFLFTGPGNY